LLHTKCTRLTDFTRKVLTSMLRFVFLQLIFLSLLTPQAFAGKDDVPKCPAKIADLSQHREQFNKDVEEGWALAQRLAEHKKAKKEGARLLNELLGKIPSDIARVHRSFRFFSQGADMTLTLGSFMKATGEVTRDLTFIDISESRPDQLSAGKDLFRRYYFSKIEVAKNNKGLILYGDADSAVSTITIDLQKPFVHWLPAYQSEIVPELIKIELKRNLLGLKSGKNQFANRVKGGVIGLVGYTYREFKGQDADDLLQTLAKQNLRWSKSPEGDDEGDYRGLVFIRNSDGILDAFFMNSPTEFEYLLRGLRALNLNPAHPIFVSDL
jgi:hypothetical protein